MLDDARAYASRASDGAAAYVAAQRTPEAAARRASAADDAAAYAERKRAEAETYAKQAAVAAYAPSLASLF